MTKRKHIWIVDDDKSIRWVLERALQQANFEVTSFSGGNGVMAALARAQPNVIVSDVRMPGIDGLELMQQIKNVYPELPVVIMTAHSDLDSAVNAFHGGAFEYLPKPFDVDEAVDTVRRASEFRKTETADTQEAEIFPEIIGEAPAMQEVFRAIGRLARSNAAILINGESGTGKELVARALHRHSPRAEKPFIALNMAAIPRDLLESELFGHERGAFTGAQSRRAGRFEQANGGTLFLDEIGDMPADLQTRLLRVLAEGEFFTVGGHTAVRTDVRIIAATHQDLHKLVAEGRFREDLFHRLNVIPVNIPPLRERREDIPQLMRYFLAQAAVDIGVDAKGVSTEVERYISQLDFRGNVRELENLCSRLTVMASGQTIVMDDLPKEILGVADTAEGDGWEQQLCRWADKALAGGATPLLNEALPRFETILIECAIQHTGGRRQDAAKLLGWGRNTLTRKIKELGLKRDKN